jgi:hypothetical protein
MFQGFASQKRYSFGCFFGLLLVALAAPAAADRLELAAQIEGWDCTSPRFLAASADGADLYVGGDGTHDNHAYTCYGFAWFRRDPASGRLELGKIWGHMDLDDEQVHGLDLSPDGRHLYAGVGEKILIFERAPGGELQLFETHTANYLDGGPLSVSPDGLEVWTKSSFGIRIFARSANGLLTFKQFFQHYGGYPTDPVFFLDAERAISNSVFYRRQGGTWSADPLVLPDSLRSLVAGGGRYLYGLAMSDYSEPTLLTYELLAGIPVEVARLKLFDSYSRPAGSLAFHPESGDLYLTSNESPSYDQVYASVRRYVSRDGGRTFSYQGSVAERIGWTGNPLLAFSPDGRHLYSSFAGETVALFEVSAASGLRFIPDGVDPAARFRRAGRVVPAANGDLYLSAPGALLLARWTAGKLKIVDKFTFEGWQEMETTTELDLAITPGGTLAIVAAASSFGTRIRLAMADRNPATGELRLRPETTAVIPDVLNLPHLTLSPDGRYLYVRTSGYLNPVHAFYLRRDSVLKLVPVATYYNDGEAPLVLSPDGREAFLGGDYYRRDVATGLLERGPAPWADFARGTPTYSRGGNLLAVIENFDQATAEQSYRVLERGPGGWNQLYRGLLPQSIHPLTLLADPQGRHFFLRTLDRAAYYTEAVELWEWDAGFEPLRLSHRVEDRERLYEHNLRSAQAISGDGNLYYSINPNRGLLDAWRVKCEPDGYFSACLGDGRFRVEIDWRDARGVPHPAEPANVGSDDSRLFTFFSPDNWEVLTKVLDGCAINGKYWVYSAATTDVGYDLRVIDTWSGKQVQYSNPAGTPAAAVTDGGALDVCAVPSPGWVPIPASLPPVVPAGEVLKVRNDRFEVSAIWTTATGLEGRAQALSARTESAGLFYFFSPDNWEIQAKVLDGCAINGHFWFFAAATTDVGYELTVRDRLGDREKVYRNPVGRASPAITDIGAFACP